MMRAKLMAAAGAGQRRTEQGGGVAQAWAAEMLSAAIRPLSCRKHSSLCPSG